MNPCRYIFILVIGIWLATTRDAAAYVDPGSSSYLFQLLIAGLTAVVFFFSTIKRKTGEFLRRLTRDKRADTPAVTAEAPAPRDL